MNTLLTYDWPGNVRELRTAIEHGVVMASGPKVTVRDLPRAIARIGRATPPVPSLVATKKLIALDLARNGKATDHAGACYHRRKHYRCREEAGHQPSHPAPQDQRNERAGSKCAQRSARRQKTYEIMASAALHSQRHLSGFERVDRLCTKSAAAAMASAPRQSQFFRFTNAGWRS